MPLLKANRIFWAVDPFSDPISLQRSAAWAIHSLTRENPASRIQPIYMAGDWPTSIVPQRLVRTYLEKMEEFARDSMKRITRGVPLENLDEIEIISAHFDSVDQGVRALLSTASQRGADLLVASTRARRAGGGPFTLPGSFVETLSDISEIPLLTVNPSWRYATGVPSVLFPTDLSYESQEWFIRTLDFARTMKSKVTLFHKIAFPLSQPFESAVRIFPELRDMLYRKVQASQTEAKRWVREGKRRQVGVSVVIDSKMTASLSDALLSRLKVHPASIVVAPPISISYPRSTLRKLMRHSTFPMVLVPAVLRPEARAFGARRAA